MEAKLRGAKVIHIDPRFSRTSALADTHVPNRAGSDIAFLGGIVNYILSNRLDFREYLLAYTNAATIVTGDFRDTEDLDGLFSGFDPEGRGYDITSWMYKGHEPDSVRHDTATQRATASGLQHESHGPGVAATTERDETLQHPHRVYQILKRHFSRYSPEVVEAVCGASPRKFEEVCRGRAVPHRVRHGGGPGGRLQRLRQLHPRLPLRGHRPARGRRARVEVHAVLRPHRRWPDASVRHRLPQRVHPVRAAGGVA
jgi:formate dehydrogenase major subunit